MNRPTKVVLHCSATPDSKKSIYSVGDIRRWHVYDNGWSDIGYHWYLTRDGVWHKGRSESVKGAHAGASGNLNSIGVCYEGTFQPSESQIKALCEKYLDLKKRYGISYHHWQPHYKYKASKTCPGFGIELIRTIFRLYEKSRQIN